MVLALAGGFALQELAGIRDAVPWSLLLGLIVATLVPGRTSCALRPRPKGET